MLASARRDTAVELRKIALSSRAITGALCEIAASSRDSRARDRARGFVADVDGDANVTADCIHCPHGETHPMPDRIHAIARRMNAITRRMNAIKRRINAMA